MTEPMDLKRIEQRPAKYWNADGLPELMMGVTWILWGGAMWFGQSLPRGTAWNAYWMITPAFLALSGVAATWATRKLKARITFPRGGYVAWKEPTRAARLASAGIAAVTAAALVGLIARSRAAGVEQIVVPGFGVLLSVGFVVASLKQRAPHLLVLAGVALMLGLAFSVRSAGWDSMNWMLIAIGAASALVGAVRLRLFLRQNPLEARA